MISFVFLLDTRIRNITIFKSRSILIKFCGISFLLVSVLKVHELWLIHVSHVKASKIIVGKEGAFVIMTDKCWLHLVMVIFLILVSTADALLLSPIIEQVILLETIIKVEVDVLVFHLLNAREKEVIILVKWVSVVLFFLVSMRRVNVIIHFFVMVTWKGLI